MSEFIFSIKKNPSNNEYHLFKGTAFDEFQSYDVKSLCGGMENVPNEFINLEGASKESTKARFKELSNNHEVVCETCMRGIDLLIPTRLGDTLFRPIEKAKNKLA